MKFQDPDSLRFFNLDQENSGLRNRILPRFGCEFVTNLLLLEVFLARFITSEINKR